MLPASFCWLGWNCGILSCATCGVSQSPAGTFLVFFFSGLVGWLKKKEERLRKDAGVRSGKFEMQYRYVDELLSWLCWDKSVAVRRGTELL